MLFPETVLHEGDLIGVLDALIEKERLLAAGSPLHETIRPILVGQGGALRGVSGAGFGAALDHYGLREAFDASYTASTSTPAESYRLAGQLPFGRSVYWTECTTPEFFTLRKVFEGKHPMDIDYLCDGVFRGKTPRNVRLDVSSMQQSRTDFFAAVTVGRTGEGAFIDMKRARDPINVIRASIALPFASHGDVDLEGESCLDGAVAFPFPATKAVALSRPTHVLILANCPKDEPVGSLESKIAAMVPGTLSQATKKMFESRADRYARELAAFKAQTNVCWAILYCSKRLHPFDQNAQRLQAASEHAEHYLGAILAERKLAQCA